MCRGGHASAGDDLHKRWRRAKSPWWNHKEVARAIRNDKWLNQGWICDSHDDVPEWNSSGGREGVSGSPTAVQKGQGTTMTEGAGHAGKVRGAGNNKAASRPQVG